MFAFWSTSTAYVRLSAVLDREANKGVRTAQYDDKGSCLVEGIRDEYGRKCRVCEENVRLQLLAVAHEATHLSTATTFVAALRQNMVEDMMFSIVATPKFRMRIDVDKRDEITLHDSASLEMLT